jgi:tetratricopeptide (TPR) repeat protein
MVSMTARRGVLEREAELAAVMAALDRVGAGEATVVLIEGPAGIGKTSLLEEATARAEKLGLRRLIARPAPLEREVAWNVVRQLFLPVVSDGVLKRSESLLAGAAGLALPALGLGDSRGGELDPFSPLHGLYWLVENLARDRATVIAIDDFHWADVRSARFISHLASRIEGVPVVLLIAIRTGEPTDDGGATLATFRAFSSVRTLVPGPLTRSASAVLLRDQLPDAVTEEVIDTCYELTGGNPFLLSELVRELSLREGTVSVDTVRSMNPRAVSRSMQARLARLDPGASSLARALAVLGGRAGLHVAGQLADLSPGDAVAAAELLIDAGVLVEGPQDLGFVHPLVREAVYRHLSGPVRWGMHASAARLLAAGVGAEREVGAHLLATAPSSDQWTVARLRAAARSARGEGAPEIAGDYLRRALAEPPAREHCVDVLVELGLVESEYDLGAAVGRLAEAHKLADRPEQRVRTAQLYGRALAVSGDYEAAARVVNRVADEASGIDPRLRSAFTAARFAICRWDVKSQPTRRGLFAELRERARRGEPLQGPEHANLATELVALGEDRVSAVDHTRAAIASSFLAVIGQTVDILALMLVFADQTEEAKQVIDGALADAQQRGSLTDSASATSAAALAALYSGQITEAVALGQDALKLAEHGAESILGLSTFLDALVERGTRNAGAGLERALRPRVRRAPHGRLAGDAALLPPRACTRGTP